jgi:hypothetical protein
MAILDCNAAAAPRPPSQEDQHFYFTAMHPPVKLTLHHGGTEAQRKTIKRFSLCLCVSVVKKLF